MRPSRRSPEETAKDSAGLSLQIMGDQQRVTANSYWQVLSEQHSEQIQGGGRRRRDQNTQTSSQGLAGKRTLNTAINNMFVQINIAMYFVFGGENVSVFGMQNNAAENEVFFKVT
ncbi:hypothetical protein [Vulcanococcus sp.]|uniref:hypothetical protein n=1 Tax=Vulcanococcus sp. TaxID=2856995 RepID=UPI003C0427E7